MATKKIQIVDSLVKQAENADTLDGKHADEFAAASDVETLKTQVGDSAISEQISAAITNKVDKVAGVQGNAVVFGADGAIVDSGKVVPTIYIVPHYDSETMTDTQKAEIVSVVNQIKADTGSYAVFIKPSGNNRVFHATCEISNRNTIITAVDHDESTSFKYYIKVTSAGVVTTTRNNFFATDLDTTSPMQPATTSYVIEYVEAEIESALSAVETGSKTYVLIYDTTGASDESNLATYNEMVADYTANGSPNFNVMIYVNGVDNYTNLYLPADIQRPSSNLWSCSSTEALNGHCYSMDFSNSGSSIIYYHYNTFTSDFNEHGSVPASQKATADWVKSYIEETITNGEW